MREDYTYALVVFGLVLYTLVTGKISGRGRWGRRGYSWTRADDPIKYWGTVTAYVILGIFFTGEGRREAQAMKTLEKQRTAEAAVDIAQAAQAAQVPARLDVAALPPEIVAIRDSAFALHRLKLYADAIVQYDQVIAWTRDDAQTFYWRANAHWRLGRTDLALRDFQRVVALEPTNANARKYADQLAATSSRR